MSLDMNTKIHVEARVRVWLVLLTIGTIFCTLFAFMLNTPALAHTTDNGWEYPSGCCNNGDCERIPASAVKQTPNGYEVTLLPGMHHQVKTKTFRHVVPYAVARPAPDGEYHICLAPEPSLTFRCFYRGPDGV